MWTQFWDMHSGGHQKLKWAMIYIEAPEEEAEVIFQNRFGRNPHRVTCTCCGEDYHVDSEEDLAQSTAYHRGCQFKVDKRMEGGGKYIEEPRADGLEKYQTLDEYKKDPNVLFIYAADIKPEERKGELRREGYVWAEDEDDD